MYKKIDKTGYLILIYFLLIISIMIVSNYTFLGVQDEAQLLATLKSNEPINYMTSYPFAVVVGYLYSNFPSIQWYSISITLYLILISFIMAYYVVRLEFENKALTYLAKFALLMMFTILLIYMLVLVDVTFPTLILIALAIPFIKYNQIYFWILVWIASFLRVQIIFSLAPLLFIIYILMVDKKSVFKRKTLFLSLFLLISIIFNNFSYMLNKEYKDWMEFTEKRAYFTDFGGAPKGNILSADEFHLARTWWIVDQDLYPYKKVISSAGTTLDVIKLKFNQHSVKTYTLMILKNHSIVYLLFLASLLLCILYRSWIKFFGYFSFAFVVILLLIVKDVDRVTIPIFFIWSCMLIVEYWHLKDRLKIISSIAIITLVISLIFTLYNSFPKNRILHFKQREALAYELKEIIKRNNMELEITTGFPSSWEYLIEGIMQNHLFDEKNWVDYYDDLLLQGWFSRVPLVYKQHNVSFGGVKRKYEHYHDWLMSSKAGIIGSKGENRHIRIFLKRNLMSIYDKKFPKEGCKHQSIVADESKHFVIHKIIYYCTNKKGDKELWRLQDNIKNIKTDNLEFKDNKIVIKGKDPKFYIKFDKKLPKYIVIHIVIKSEKKEQFQLFYKYNNKTSYSEANSIIKELKKGVNNIEILIPSKYLKYSLRVDPVASNKGKLIIDKFTIYPYIEE